MCVTFAVPPALREHFHFEAGQYVTVRRMIDGREERRTYSIVTAPGGSAIALGRSRADGRSHVARAGGPRTARRHAGGRNADRTVPHRRRPRQDQSYVAFAAGSGITPVLSLATDILGARAAKPLHADLRQPQHGAHHVPRGHARAQESPSRPILGAFRDEPRAATHRAAQWADRCGQDSRSSRANSWRSPRRTNISCAVPGRWPMKCARP